MNTGPAATPYNTKEPALNGKPSPLAPLNVLLAEDNPSDIRLLRHELQKAFWVTLTQTDVLQEFTDYLSTNRYDLIISDYNMHQFTGLDTLAVRQRLAPSTPFIIVTGAMNEEVAVACLKAGADDYVLKDHVVKITTAISAVLDRARMRDKAAEMQAQNLYLAGLLEQVHDAIISYDREFNVVSWNRGAEHLYGFTQEEVKGKSIRALCAITPADKSFEQVIEELNIHGTATQETMHLHRDGHEVFVHSSLTVLRNEHGTVTGYVTINRDITEKKKHENTAATLTAAMGASLDGIGVLDSNRRLVVFNDAFVRLSGYTPEELTGMHYQNFYTKEEYSRILSMAAQSSYAQTGYLRGEATAQRKDGSLLVHEFSITAMPGGSVVCTVHDIGERKQREAQLRQLFLAVDQNPATVVITDLQGRIAYVNKQFTLSTGYTQEEALGKDLSLIRSEETPSEVFAEMWRTILAGESWTGVLQNKRKDGSPFWEDVLISPVKDESGTLTSFIAIKQDITEKRRTEAALRDSEERFRVMVEATNDVLYSRRFNTPRYEYISPKIIMLTGYSVEEINELGISAITQKIKVLGRNVSGAAEFQELRLQGAETLWEADLLIKTKSGAERWLFDRSFPWFDSNGRILGSIGILSDITARKMNEAALLEAQRKAEEMNRVKSNFLANMSHELRTPLIGILGYAEMLMYELQDEEKQAMAQSIFNGGERLLNTLNLILDLSRLEKGIIPHHNSAVNINELISSLLAEHEDYAAKKSLFLDKEFRYPGSMLFTDARLLREILYNLINNAIKFTHAGGVTVSTQPITSEGRDWIAISIADSGIGIPEESQSVIWEEFRQASEGFARAFEGTGLGLTIAKRFTERLGGSISFTSKPGKGSVFTITLPAIAP